MSDRTGDERDRASRKACYERVQNTVRYNTGGPQPPACTEHTVFLTAAVHGNQERSDVESALRANVENGDLCRLVDGTETARYCVADADVLREVAKWAADRSEPDKTLISEANKAKARLERRTQEEPTPES